MVLYGIVNV